MVRESCQRRSKRLCKTDGLEYDAAQLLVQRRVVIGLEVLLIPILVVVTRPLSVRRRNSLCTPPEPDFVSSMISLAKKLRSG